MISQTATHSKEKIIELVNKYLEPHQPQEFRLLVKPEGIKLSDDVWYVTVRPTRDDIRMYDYYGRLAEAEGDLQDHEHITVLLVPVIPS